MKDLLNIDRICIVVTKNSNNYNSHDNILNSVVLIKHQLNLNRSVIFIISLFTLSTVIVISDNYPIQNGHAQSYPFMASTRGTFDPTSGSERQPVELPSALSILNVANNCPGELVVYVHGIWADEQEAQEQTDRVFQSLLEQDYNVPVIGFSWDSNTFFSKYNPEMSLHGWNIAKQIANENGPILGKFISDYKGECPDDKVRIVAHSLGSRVTLSAIQWLFEGSRDNNMTNMSETFHTVHLLGAAVNNYQISKNSEDCEFFNPYLPCSGIAIEAVVGQIYNLYNPEDNMLTSEYVLNPFCQYCYYIYLPSPYEFSEQHDAMGANPIKDFINTPSNFDEHLVSSSIIPDVDTNKDNQCDVEVNLKLIPGITQFDYYLCTITKYGDNHMGYMGYRNGLNTQIVYAPGAIEQVVIDWRNENN